ncbi:molybdopterin-dependent oxidoreductase [Aestuariirhabdus sp. Z084]|uniref:molybdopterin-dependent oxidoreductase n=1 Tax=Aestuariirhabdus haliotis TaxID=2918751 RepID=UPI00201B4220|nr:molybdopterin-dependent oxidoreductase [Aestuariirhabdus haliotis]MCL6417346.1 molybdopterin-dependent oxidoreductase [Aestuariirhabdus haliotis]MCL6421291.1 molybdopterin-dependent oxidoreductase [Aestuariirhabdus haliotis]
MNTSGSSQNQQHSGACILCSRNCGIAITTENGRITKIKGDPLHPVTKGYICQKAARLAHYQHHDDRLTQPLKRQPDGGFEAISWDQALSEIADRMGAVRDQFGGDAFAIVGGGGQGNHLGGAFAQQLRYAMGKSRYVYSALAQEKTMDFWVNGRLFGDQRVHATEDVEHADYVLFIGCNPYQSHGIPNARDTLKQIKKDPQRTMVVFDPRRTETAKMADIHFQLKPGTDAYLLSAILSIIVREELHDKAFVAAHCTGFEALQATLLSIPVEEYVNKADVSLDTVFEVARGFARAKNGCVRIDLGLQQTLHSTVTAYLEKMLYILTGNFAKKGGNNLHTSFLPLLGNTDERKRDLKLTAHHKMMPISGMYPPNILPDEIEHDGEDRLRAVWVDSSNPVMSFADSQAYERAFKKLDLLVVVDVALTETARLADYVLPAASQFEKWEATGFNAEFPENFFHLRPAILEPTGDCLPEPEIYTRLLNKMGMIPETLPVLSTIARYEPTVTGHQLYLSALMASVKANKQWAPFVPSILYRTLGPALPDGANVAALILPLAIDYATKHAEAVKRTGIKGNRFTLGVNLFRHILKSRSGAIISRHNYSDLWRFIKNEDQRIHLEIDEVLQEMRGLQESEKLPNNVSVDEKFPLILMAGERRAYNSNQIFRNPEWRKVDPYGFLRIHPEDAARHNIASGDWVACKSSNGQLQVVAEVDDSVREGMVTLPHGYGMRYQDSEPNGPALNRLTAGSHCDPFTKTPYHKYVPVALHKLAS